MAPLSLKIILEAGAVTRTIVFDSNTMVSEAHHIVKEKLPTGDDGKDYGLFLASADDSLSGIWLEGFRNLEYYMLRPGDSLHYLNRLRTLRVRMLDGSVKTLQVTESQPLGELMPLICEKVGIANADEYGLCHEEAEEGEEAKEKPVVGTLTLKRKAQQKERDAKMEQLSKKLKTDDNVEWLDQHKTLREMGVDPQETLLLKRRLFYSDRNVDSRDPVQLNLLYLQARNAILAGKQPVTEEQAHDCKVRWINIRDVNRRMLRKSLSTPGKRIRHYKYEKELSFMRPFYRDVLIHQDEFESDGDDNANDVQTNDDEEMAANDTESDDDHSQIPVKKRKNKTRKIKIQDVKGYEEDQPEVFNESVPQELDPTDPVDAFLLSIGATLKTFSPYHLNLAKSKIFSVVQEHDLEQIMQKERHELQGTDVKVSSDNMYLQ